MDGDIWAKENPIHADTEVTVIDAQPMTVTKTGCPYGAEGCPKTDNIKGELEKITKALSSLTRIVYVITGIIAIKFGVMLW